jgi:hypothetical protein
MLPEGSNGFDGDQLDKYLDQIHDADDELVALKTEHMRACKVPRGKIRSVMTQAKAEGLNMAAFRAVVAKARAERKVDQTIAELEADDKADFEAMQAALGDYGSTPLGEAALKKAAPKDDGALDRLGRG